MRIGRMMIFALMLTLFPMITAQAQSSVVWDVSYYNNIYLLGEATHTTQTTNVSFDWGADSPVPGVINADGFSARFVSRPTFAAGTYRFFARADDKIRVSVNFQTVVTTFGTDNVGDVVYADVTLPAGVHQIQVDYREEAGDAFAFVTWENANTNPQSPNFPAVARTIVTPIDMGGWTAQYYGNATLGGLPTAILSEPELKHDWGEAAPLPSVPADNFSARWTASPTLASDTYQLIVRADDGVRVMVDGQMVVNRWGGVSVGETTTHDLSLSAGVHNFTVEYYELTSNAFVEVTLATVEETTEAVVISPTINAPLVTDPNAPQVSPPAYTNANATITAYRLNVRQEPTTNADVLVKVNRDETFAIVGRNADSSWWQIDVNGSYGWVYGDFIDVSNTGAVPITTTIGLQTTLPGTGYYLTALATINLRSEAGRSGAILSQLPNGTRAEITGRNIDGTWLQINYDGKNGWVSRVYVNTTATNQDIPIAP